MAIDFEEEARPPIVEISSTSTAAGEERESGVKQELETTSSSGNVQNPQSVQTPQNAQIPVRATTSWEVNGKGQHEPWKESESLRKNLG